VYLGMPVSVRRQSALKIYWASILLQATR